MTEVADIYNSQQSLQDFPLDLLIEKEYNLENHVTPNLHRGWIFYFNSHQMLFLGCFEAWLTFAWCHYSQEVFRLTPSVCTSSSCCLNSHKLLITSHFHFFWFKSDYEKEPNCASTNVEDCTYIPFPESLFKKKSGGICFVFFQPHALIFLFWKA